MAVEEILAACVGKQNVELSEVFFTGNSKSSLNLKKEVCNQGYNRTITIYHLSDKIVFNLKRDEMSPTKETHLKHKTVVDKTVC